MVYRSSTCRIQIDKKQVFVNPTILFSRLIVIIQREEKTTPYFDYVLTIIPNFLFITILCIKLQSHNKQNLLQIMYNHMNRMFKEHVLLKVGSLFIKLNGQGKQHTRIQSSNM